MIVTHFQFAMRKVGNKELRGYILVAGTTEVAFIHAERYARIGELLERYCASKQWQAKALMRDLLNAEDFNSPVYDKIFRVYYEGEFVVGRVEVRSYQRRELRKPATQTLRWKASGRVEEVH